MLTKRIIPCLDIKDGQTVKGVKFQNLRQAGDPVELSCRYVDEGADELVFLDISATLEGRKSLVDLVRRIALEINIPFTVGGGIRAADDVGRLLQAGADKVSVNSAAVTRPEVLTEIAQSFGSQCLVLSIDARSHDGVWSVCTHGGTVPTDLDAIQWAKRGENLGAGEILLTSMNHDGTKSGFNIELTRVISDRASIPVIASGGAGSAEHFKDVFRDGHADAALAASIFHYGEVPIPELKQYLRDCGLPMRL